MSSEGNSLTLESDSVFHDEWYFSPPGASEMTVTGERMARKSGVERAERVGETVREVRARVTHVGSDSNEHSGKPNRRHANNANKRAISS